VPDLFIYLKQTGIHSLIYFLAHLFIKKLKRNLMKDDEKNFPEPPELRRQGIPPLKKQVRLVVILIAIAFVIVLIFALAFYFHDKH
jgi:predicted ferric reductase